MTQEGASTIMEILNLEKVRQLMKADRWNSRSLALAAGLPQATVWRTVRGNTAPSLETLSKIARVLKVRIADLLIETVTEERKAA
jgi:transcriptional regulator with XRE-family HTH domain